MKIVFTFICCTDNSELKMQKMCEVSFPDNGIFITQKNLVLEFHWFSWFWEFLEGGEIILRIIKYYLRTIYHVCVVLGLNMQIISQHQLCWHVCFITALIAVPLYCNDTWTQSYFTHLKDARPPLCSNKSPFRMLSDACGC